MIVPDFFLTDRIKKCYFGEQKDDLDVHLPSKLMKMKPRFMTWSFILYDAEILQTTFKYRTVMELRKVNNIEDVYMKFVISRSFPNLTGAWRPLDLLLTEYNRVFVIYDVCFHITLRGYISHNIEELVVGFEYRHFSPTAVRLLR